MVEEAHLVQLVKSDPHCDGQWSTPCWSRFLVRLSDNESDVSKLSYLFPPIPIDDSLQPQDSLKRLYNSCHSYHHQGWGHP